MPYYNPEGKIVELDPRPFSSAIRLRLYEEFKEARQDTGIYLRTALEQAILTWIKIQRRTTIGRLAEALSEMEDEDAATLIILKSGGEVIKIEI